MISVALNDEHILSGSGDPGYYHRLPRDATVRLWRRDGSLLKTFQGHVDSVRAVCLFKSSELKHLAVSGALDGQVMLWHLENGKAFSSCQLSGACRSLQILCQQGSRARLLAGAGEGVAELAVHHGLQQLRFVAAYVEVASIASRPTELQRQDMEQGRWPRSFLSSLRVAVGGVDGQLALLQGSCRAVHDLFRTCPSGDHEIISIAPRSLDSKPKQFKLRSI